MVAWTIITMDTKSVALDTAMNMSENWKQSWSLTSISWTSNVGLTSECFSRRECNLSVTTRHNSRYSVFCATLSTRSGRRPWLCWRTRSPSPLPPCLSSTPRSSPYSCSTQRSRQSRQQPPRPAAAAGRHRGQWRHQGRGHRRLLGRRGAVHIRAASGGAHVLETRQQDVPQDARRLWWPLTISHRDPADASQAVAVAGGHTGHWKGGGGLRYVASKSHQTLLCTQKIYIDNDRYVWKDLYYHWFGLISFQAYRRADIKKITVLEVCKYGSHRISPCLRQ